MTINRRHWLSGSAAMCLPGLTPAWAVAAPMSSTPLSADERALHAFNRLAFGPRPSDSAAIRRLGAGPWLNQFLAAQLNPASIAVAAASAARLEGFDTLHLRWPPSRQGPQALAGLQRHDRRTGRRAGWC